MQEISQSQETNYHWSDKESIGIIPLTFGL
jgi:hypothetical protein